MDTVSAKYILVKRLSLSVGPSFEFCRFDVFQDVLTIKTKSPFCFTALFPPPIHSSSHITLVMDKFHAPYIPRGTNTLLAACLIELM